VIQSFQFVSALFQYCFSIATTNIPIVTHLCQQIRSLLQFAAAMKQPLFF